jgi:GNAT superfamily N-acetyltransferase
MPDIKEILDPAKKSAVCDRILRVLPSWFGVEESIVDYVKKVADMPFFAAVDGEEIVGFAALKIHNDYTGEVCVMGVLEGYHRRGIGRRLIEALQAGCRERGLEYLTVKTLAATVESAGYARTRAFYLAMGFRPLEIFPLFWDEANPCLFMAMKL